MRFELSLNPSFEELYRTLYNKDIYKVLGIDYDNLDIMNFRHDFIYNNMDLSAISVDANANVNQKTFVQYKEDAFKPFGKLTTYNALYNCLEEFYDTETADICVGKLLTGELFLNDASSFDMPYCWAVSLDTILSEGYQSAQFHIQPPKRSSSFCNVVIQLIAEISNQMLGAVALPDFFVLLDWFLRREYGEDYAGIILDNIKAKPEIEQLFQHLIFSFNWHFRGGEQSAFINLSLLDKGFLEQVFGNYMYPDLSKPDLVSIKKLSMAFFKKFSEMYGTEGMFTFPVFTLGISKDDNNEFLDPELVDWIVENNYQKSLGNNLISKPTLLASCCFGGDQLVITSNKYDGITCKPIKEVVNEAKNTNFTIFHNGSFAKGSKVKLPVGNKKVYKITTVKNSELIVTEDHLHLTPRGDIRTDKLTEDDYLATSNIPLNITACNDTSGRNLTYEQGVLIGAFVGDGYRHYTEKTNSYDVNFAISEKKLHLLPLLKRALEDFGIDKEIHINEGSHNVIFLKIYDETLYNIIGDYVLGDEAINKSLNINNVLHGSIDFREGIKFGWLSTDGSNGNRIYSSSPDLIKTGQVLLTSLGYVSHIWTDERIGSIYFRGEEAQRTNKVQCIKFQKACSKRKEKDVFKIINNTTFIKIKSIEEVEYNDEYVYCFEMENQEEPYFTLANGIITHNCRLKNGIERMENGVQNSFGVSSVSIGSHRVCGLNLPRIMQFTPDRLDEDLNCVHKILLCHRRHLAGHIKNGLLPLYTKKLLFLHKQYSTIGYLGLYEGLKNIGSDILTEEGLKIAKKILKKLDDFAIQCAKDDIDANIGLKTTYNVEQIPAESMAIRLAKMDKILGFNKSNTELYSNQFIPLTKDCSLYDRLRIQGELDEYSSGGSILHLSHFEDKPIPKEQYKRILDMARQLGCTYFAFNYAFSKCKNGHTILGIYEDSCPICEAEMDGVYSRVVGFVTKVDKWHPVRKKEFKQRKNARLES